MEELIMKVVKYFKAKPTEYVLHYRNNKCVRSGVGLSFFYYTPNSNLVKVPINSIDLPFIFNEPTLDYQTVTIQGQLTYRIKEVEKIAKMLDFSIDHKNQYTSEDPEHLKERLIHLTQVSAKNIVNQLPLDQALIASKQLVSKVLDTLKASPAIQELGIEILDFNILSIKASPEMTKALEAKTREELLRGADAAMYDRRNASVEQERKIKENELQTEIKIEQEKRKIREIKMAADIEIEEKRAQLVDKKVLNDKKQADSQAYAMDAIVKAIKNTDWHTIMALFSGNKIDSNLMIAMAFKDLAENAAKIGELNISPDLLKSLLKTKDGGHV